MTPLGLLAKHFDETRIKSAIYQVMVNLLLEHGADVNRRMMKVIRSSIICMTVSPW